MQTPDDGVSTKVAAHSFRGGEPPLGLVRGCEVDAPAMVGSPGLRRIDDTQVMNECRGPGGEEGGAHSVVRNFGSFREGPKNYCSRLSEVGQMRVTVQRRRNQVVKRDSSRGYHEE